MPRIPATSVRSRCGICVEECRVSDRSPARQSAITPRVSMAVGIRRWLVMRWRHDHVGVAECLVDVAALLVEGERDVVGPLGMHRRGAGRERLFGVGDGGQVFVIDFHQVGGVARDVAVRGDHDGHRMADVVDAVLRQQMMMRHAQPGSDAAHGTGPRFLMSSPVKPRPRREWRARGFGIDAFDFRGAHTGCAR